MFSNSLCSKEEITAIKNSQDPELIAFAKETVEEAEKLLDQENSRLDAIQMKGFAYHYTGDARYLENARKIIDSKINKELWISNEYDPTRFNGYDIRTALETGDRCAEMAYLVSLFGEELTEDEIKACAKATYEKGILPILEDWVRPNRKLHALDTMGHNFWVTTISNSGLAAVVFKDYIPDAEDCINDVIRAVKAWFEYKGNILNAKPQNMDNGGYYEGIGYSDYSTKEYLNFAIAHKRILGTHPFDDEELITLSVKFQMNTSYNSSRKDYNAGFGDCGNSYRYTPLQAVRYGLGTPEIRWFIKEKVSLNNDRVLKLLTWNEVYGKEAKMPETLSCCYDKIGWAAFKSTNEKDGDMLMIKCGDTWNHAHADCASFVLFRNGKPEILENMTYGGYSSKQYQGYYVTSQAHNVLLFNDKGQDYRDNYKNHAHLPGRLLNYVDDRGFRYVVADGTGPMSRYFRKHHRHFLWLDGFILVYDDVECYDFGKVSFLLHAQKEHCFKMLSPCTETFCDGYDETTDKPNFKYSSFNVHTDDEGHAKFVGIMVLDKNISPIYEEIEGGCRITCGKTKVYINFRSDGKIMHRNCINIMDGIATDCMILVDDGEKYGIVNGSIIRKDGVSHLDTLARVTGWADKYK